MSNERICPIGQIELIVLPDCEYRIKVNLDSDERIRMYTWPSSFGHSELHARSALYKLSNDE